MKTWFVPPIVVPLALALLIVGYAVFRSYS